MASSWSVKQLYKDVLEARSRIQNYVRNTPLDYSPDLSKQGQAKVYLKLDNEQVTGSFKCRGAHNKILKCAEDDPDFVKKGITLASSGNHALGCVKAMTAVGCSGKVFLSSAASQVKIDMLKDLGADVHIHGDDCVEAEIEARKTAENEGSVYVSPYNDLVVMAGQGTIGAEILEALPELDTIIVSVGGGGLIGGIAAYLKHVKPSVKVIGCQPINSKVMYESIQAGKIVEEESADTLSDGTAGGLEENCVSLDVCQKVVDDWVLLNEEEIAYGTFFMLDKHHKMVEGAAGMAVAGYLKMKEQMVGQTVAILICGSSISTKTLKTIINTYA